LRLAAEGAAGVSATGATPSVVEKGDAQGYLEDLAEGQMQASEEILIPQEATQEATQEAKLDGEGESLRHKGNHSNLIAGRAPSEPPPAKGSLDDWEDEDPFAKMKQSKRKRSNT